jgi:putative DNA primase/helicase
MIDKEDKEKILEKTDSTSLFSELIRKFKIIKSDQATGLCPFHDDHNPSLSLNLTSGVFNCFSCGAKGGAIDLCMEVWGADFKTTLHRLAERVGIKTAVNSTSNKPRCVATFHYTNIEGKRVYWKERWEYEA